MWPGSGSETKNGQRGVSEYVTEPFWGITSQTDEATMNKIRPYGLFRILAACGGPYHRGEEYVKCDLPLFKVMVPTVQTGRLVVGVGVLGRGHEADCQNGSLRVVLWLTHSCITMPSRSMR